MIAVTFPIGVVMVFLVATMEDLAGVTTKLLSVGVSMVIREKTARYLRTLPPVIQVYYRS